ncbi:MAG: hypothetical protein Q8O52_04190, partial [Sulfuritalea sp.]|nr:hypothetical protein [Sulfuritalea sp.]
AGATAAGDIFLNQTAGALEVGTAIGLDGRANLNGIVTSANNNDITLTAPTGGIAFGASTVAGYLDVTAGGPITQTGLLTIGGNLWAKTTSGNIILNSFQNVLGGTVSLIAPRSFGVAGAGSDVKLKANSIKVGTARPSDGSILAADTGIQAARVTIEAPLGGSTIKADGTQGLITADAPFSSTTASLTIDTRAPNGVIGNPATGSPTTEGLRVHTSGLVVVLGNAVGDGTIMLVGDNAVQPKYEFSGDPLHRSVKYNGVEATNAQLTGALDAAYLDIRNMTTEIRESGFAKENASKVLRRGVVTSAGPGQPAVDDSTGMAGLESCDGKFGGNALTCQ